MSEEDLSKPVDLPTVIISKNEHDNLVSKSLEPSKIHPISPNTDNSLQHSFNWRETTVWMVASNPLALRARTAFTTVQDDRLTVVSATLRQALFRGGIAEETLDVSIMLISQGLS